jgi:hydrogenase expression/formation protein HypE
MRYGKLTNEELKDNVLGVIGHRRAEIKTGSSLALDCAAFALEGEGLITSDPITGAGENIGSLAIQVNANDIISCGGEPVAILLTIIAPPDTRLEAIKKIMQDAEREAIAQNMQIIGGHTEFSDAVTRIIVCATAIGKSDNPVFASGAQIGDDIVLTKYAALEGTAIIASDMADRLKGALTQEELEYARSLSGMLSIAQEGKIASSLKVNAMHDVTEGGVIGAVSEMAQAAGAGAEIYADKIPLLEVTKKIAEALNIDPLRLISSGSLLICSPEGEKVVRELEKAQIKGTIIGKIVKGDKTLLIRGKEVSEVTAEADHLFKIGV